MFFCCFRSTARFFRPNCSHAANIMIISPNDIVQVSQTISKCPDLILITDPNPYHFRASET